MGMSVWPAYVFNHQQHGDKEGRLQMAAHDHVLGRGMKIIVCTLLLLERCKRGRPRGCRRCVAGSRYTKNRKRFQDVYYGNLMMLAVASTREGLDEPGMGVLLH